MTTLTFSALNNPVHFLTPTQRIMINLNPILNFLPNTLCFIAIEQQMLLCFISTTESAANWINKLQLIGSIMGPLVINV
jgi:hypothetical protein